MKPTAPLTFFAALITAALICATPGCRAARNVEKKLDSMEKELQEKPGEIAKELVVTFTNMTAEHEQYLKCMDYVRVYRKAQVAYRKHYKTYTEDLAALYGNNPDRLIYIKEKTRRRMAGVCETVQTRASDTDYNILFETDKKALVEQMEQQLEQGGLTEQQKEMLRNSIAQLKKAEPCQITATDHGVTSSGQCGFENSSE